MKGLIIENKPSVCLYCVLCAVNWQFSVVEICEKKGAYGYKEKPLCVKSGVH